MEQKPIITPQEAPKTESPVAPSAAPDTAPKTISPIEERLAMLEQREKQLRAEARKLEASKKQIEADRASYKDALKVDQWREKFLTDPTSVGLSYDEIAQRYLQQPSEEDQRLLALKAEVEKAKEESRRALETIDNSRKQAYEQAVKQITRETNSLVESKPEYATIKAMQAQNAVVKLIEATYQEEGTLMSVEEAAQEVENYLVEEGLRYASLEKVRAKLTPVETAPQAPQKKQDTIPTITHSLVQQGRPLSNKDKRERAIAAFQGKLQG